MVKIDKVLLAYSPVRWVFDLIRSAYNLDLIEGDEYSFSVGYTEAYDIQIKESFYNDLLVSKIYNSSHHMPDTFGIRFDDGSIDLISTIFYLVNCFQEYDVPASRLDKYGRFAYSDSLQCRFDNIEVDSVKVQVAELLLKIDPQLRIPEKKSRVFLSHDIDSVYGSLKYDGLWALRQFKMIDFISIVYKTILANPPWFNIDKVLKLETEYDFKACYFWILSNGRDEHRIKNGDYHIKNSKIQKAIAQIVKSGNSLGLHKSTMKSEVDEELKNWDETVLANRYHFLKYQIPKGYEAIEDSELTIDCSLGYSSHMGFRNSFGMPYRPFDIRTMERMDLLEVPLHCMDGVFDITSRESSERSYDRLVKFIENNKSNSVISLLWHNSEMTNYAYRWSFECYKKLLLYFYEEKFETVMPSQLLKEYNRE